MSVKQTTREELRELMKRKSVGVRMLARAMGLSPSFVSEVLLGRRRSGDVTSTLRSWVGLEYERRAGKDRRQAGGQYDRRGAR